MELFFTTFASALAGFVDSIVGGGGLILLPALFAVYPNTAPATLFGTNKSASVWGTAFATWQYSRRVQVRWSALLPAAAATMLAAFAGAWLVTLVSAEFLRRLLPAVLLVVLIYTLMRKDMGRHPKKAPVPPVPFTFWAHRFATTIPAWNFSSPLLPRR